MRRSADTTRRATTGLLPYYHFTAQLARFTRPSETLAAYYRRIQDDPAETARLFGAVTLTHSPDDVLPPA